VKRFLDIGFGAAAAAQLAAAFVVQRVGAIGVTCPLRAIAGIECPFCGMTRSFVAMAHGRVGDAFAFHPAGPFLMLAMLAFAISVVVVTARGTLPLFERPRFVRGLEAVAVVCLVTGVAFHMRS
jgi:hypothetical protein